MDQFSGRDAEMYIKKLGGTNSYASQTQALYGIKVYETKSGQSLPQEISC